MSTSLASAVAGDELAVLQALALAQAAAGERSGVEQELVTNGRKLFSWAGVRCPGHRGAAPERVRMAEREGVGFELVEALEVEAPPLGFDLGAQDPNLWQGAEHRGDGGQHVDGDGHELRRVERDEVRKKLLVGGLARMIESRRGLETAVGLCHVSLP